jgi:hypothetical protein
LRQQECAVQVAANGEVAGTITLNADWRTHDLPIPPESVAESTGAIDLRFRGPRVVSAANGSRNDPRALSFQLASVGLVPAADPHGTAGEAADPPPDLNLISAAAQDVWGVTSSGFYATERADGQTFRWTERQASVIVPLEVAVPRAVRLTIARTIQSNHTMRVSANGCRLFDGLPPRPEWTVVFPLDRCHITGDELTVSIESNAIRLPTDSRELGVAVRSVQVEY